MKEAADRCFTLMLMFLFSLSLKINTKIFFKCFILK